MSRDVETSTLKLSSTIGIVAAAGLAVMLNVIAARQYKRIDVTSAKLYSLSQPTVETLRSLQRPSRSTCCSRRATTLLTSVKHLLSAYQAETTRLSVKYLDPDRNPGEFMAAQQKYHLMVGRAEDGRVVSDATVVVVRGDKRWFLTPDDLVDIGEANEGRARPKLEQGLTVAIRHVLTDERTKVCFSKGHGELGADEGGARGLGELKYRLDRNNQDVAVIDTTTPNAPEQPWKGCSLVFVAGPQQPFIQREADALKSYVESGGSLFVFANPILDDARKRVIPLGLDSVLALGGIELRGDLVIERNKAARLPDGFGEQVIPTAKAHPVTEAHVGPAGANNKLLFVLSQSLGKLSSSATQPAVLVETTNEAFGVADIFGWTDSARPPEKRAGDHEGPLTLAMAAELPKPPNSTESRGPRMIVVGTTSVTQGRSWQSPALRGNAAFVEAGISWLTSKPQIIDVPAKPSVMAGMRLTEEGFAEVRNYVVVYMPLSMALLGVAVFLRRRSTERRKSSRSDEPRATKNDGGQE
ncbi:MAG: GldG family protein [Polyangiaceae bacterium]